MALLAQHDYVERFFEVFMVALQAICHPAAKAIDRNNSTLSLFPRCPLVHADLRLVACASVA